ncbi:MAG: hypothetical protein ACRD3D_01125 [Terriglobia bacterium]
MTHGTNLPQHYSTTVQQAQEAAQREGSLIARGAWDFRARELGLTPSSVDDETLDAMREHPDAFNSDFLAQYKHLAE